MITASCNWLTGFAMTESVRFEGDYGSGHGTRHLGVEVKKETILAIANALTYTPSVTHAVWHVQNHDQPLPCQSCKS